MKHYAPLHQLCSIVLIAIILPLAARCQAESPHISFALDGRITSLIAQPSGVNLVHRANPGRGFYLISFNGIHGVSQRLSHVSVTGDRLQVSSSRGLPCFTFKITRGPRFLAINLIRVQGFPPRSLASLNLNINGKTTLKALPLDYMTMVSNRNGSLTVHWPYLWHHNPADPLGSVAFYNADTPRHADDALTEIWAGTEFPHPDIGKPWTVSQVKQWVKAYAAKFRDQSTMYIAPHNPTDLYKLTDIARKTGVKMIYLFSNIWSDGFWENSFTQVAVNREVFPAGRSDLIKYAAYLHKHGMLLALHYVSGGIGPFAPRLMGDRSVLYNLAAWASGTLARPASATATTLYFKPDPGNAYPMVLNSPAGPDELGACFTTHIVRIGSELVQVGQFQNLDTPVWTLANCRRGYGATKAKAHDAGVSCAGLDTAYGQVFSPDANSPLMARMARQWAQFVNEVGVDHFSYDGLEDQGTVPWGGVKYCNLVASFLNRGVTTNTSGGVPAFANLEMKFSQVKKLHQFGYSSVNLSIKLAGNSPASSLLGASFEIPAGLAAGARRFMILKPEPMFGISLSTLNHYGLRRRMFKLFHMWKRALPHLTSAQLAAIAKTMQPAYNHLSGRDCFVISKSGHDYRITPTRVMIRRTGDIRWFIGQEFGPVGPCQYIQPGGALLLKNPFKPQPASFIIRVLPAMEPNNSVSIEPKATSLNYHRRPDMPPPVKGILMPAISQKGNAIIITAANPFASAYWAAHGLPSWNQTLSMANARGIAMKIVGDGGGEVLLLQIHGRGTRDYVVKIDFTGARTIFIPNGEVSWAKSCWHWRMGSKNIDYAHISGFSIGFGYLPPRSHACVRVSNLMVLKNKPAALVDPVIATGAGSLQVLGNVPDGDFLQYQAGTTTTTVYDRNWRKLASLPVKLNNYVMPHGYAAVHVTSSGKAPQPWLRCQFITDGQPMVVPAGQALR